MTVINKSHIRAKCIGSDRVIESDQFVLGSYENTVKHLIAILENAGQGDGTPRGIIVEYWAHCYFVLADRHQPVTLTSKYEFYRHMADIMF